MDLLFEREGTLGVGASEGLRRVHAIAGFHPLYTRTNGFDGSSCVRPGRVGKRRLNRVGSVAHVRVIRIDAGGSDPNEYLARGRLWRGYFLDLENLWTPEITNANGFHAALLRLLLKARPAVRFDED
jgi:hypothetical protein